MNLFWKRIFGSLHSTAKMERAAHDFEARMQRYHQVGQSSELAEYKELQLIVKTADFKEKKKKLMNRKYKDTEEYAKLKRYQQLVNDHGLRRFFELQKDSEFQEFLRFRASNDFIKLADKATVKADPYLQKMLRISRSKDCKLYFRFKDSGKLTEYNTLKDEVETEDFRARNEFWANPKRWETTEEYIKDSRYYALSKNPDIVFYESVTAEELKRYESLKVTLDERFDWNSLNASNWDFGFHYANKNLKGNHSFANELQANNEGRNVNVFDGHLVISTKREHVRAAAWDVKKGFIDKEYEFTADVIQNAAAFRQKYGRFSAKIRCTGNIHHAFSLEGENKLPLVNIFHFNGEKITVGNANARIFDQVEITGIKHSDFYIYTLEWTPNELIWYVNNIEVYRTQANVPQEPLYISCRSFISDKQKGDTGTLEIDWIKVCE